MERLSGMAAHSPQQRHDPTWIFLLGHLATPFLVQPSSRIPGEKDATKHAAAKHVAAKQEGKHDPNHEAKHVVKGMVVVVPPVFETRSRSTPDASSCTRKPGAVAPGKAGAAPSPEGAVAPRAGRSSCTPLHGRNANPWKTGRSQCPPFGRIGTGIETPLQYRAPRRGSRSPDSKGGRWRRRWRRSDPIHGPLSSTVQTRSFYGPGRVQPRSDATLPIDGNIYLVVSF